MQCRRRAGQFWSEVAAAAALRRPKKVGGAGAAWVIKFSNFEYLFQQFFSTELCYKGMHVQQ